MARDLDTKTASEMAKKGWNLSPDERRARIDRAKLARWLPLPPPEAPMPSLADAIRIVTCSVYEARQAKGWDANARRLAKVLGWLKAVNKRV